jgi:hypothetical protein
MDAKEVFLKFRDKTYQAVLDGKMTKEIYAAFWDEFQVKYPEFVEKEFGYKLHGKFKKSRTLGKFALNLLSVLKEIRIKEFLNKYGKKYFPNCNLKNLKQAAIEKNGATQSGKLILNSELTNSKKAKSEADWIIDDKYRVDYKTINGMNICTPKLKDLLSYVSVNSGMLIEFFDGDDEDSEVIGMLYFSPEDVKKICDDVDSKKLKTCSFYGGKPSVQFWINPERKRAGNNSIEGYYSEYCVF